MPSLNAPTLFPIAPDANFPVTLSRAWLTDVQRTRSGKEVRQAIRARPARTLSYTASLLAAPELAQFLILWLTAPELLRYLVPLWPDYTDATAFPDAHTITADTTDRAFVVGTPALLFVNEAHVELVTLATVATDHVTTVDAIAGAWSTFPVGTVKLVPVMAAWLTPPTRAALAVTAEAVPLVFNEELPGVAGLDATVGAAVTPDGVTMTVTLDIDGDLTAGKKFKTYTAHVTDASGLPIPDPAFTWVVVSTGDVPLTDPGLSITYPLRGSQIHFAFQGDGDTQFTVTVSYGSASLLFLVNGVA